SSSSILWSADAGRKRRFRCAERLGLIPIDMRHLTLARACALLLTAGLAPAAWAQQYPGPDPYQQPPQQPQQPPSQPPPLPPPPPQGTGDTGTPPAEPPQSPPPEGTPQDQGAQGSTGEEE